MTLQEEAAGLAREALERIQSADSADAIRALEIQYLGKKARLSNITRELGSLPLEERKSAGASIHQAKQSVEQAIAAATARFASSGPQALIDPTLPGTAPQLGVVHIVNQTMDEICDIFQRMGFEIARGPHIETDDFNFTALNFPPDHPARDEHDTFFIEGDRLLRTHTTPVQARELLKRKPPIKLIMPGRTFRHEDISTRAHISFHQVDGFLVDEGITIADMKGTLMAFAQAYFGEDLTLRFRPSFFPFTEPSAEVDVVCFLCKGQGCQLCKRTGWLEILGCGMIHPNVLEVAGFDSEKYTGFAFGMGVERPAILKHRITDIRHFFNNDVRFLRQFS